MEQHNIPRLVIAGTHSGVGKTTIVTGLLAALAKQGLAVQSYKVGPDYIDPGYHELASKRKAHNLDTWLLPEDKITPLFIKTAAGADIAVVEGVMGLYDGGRNGISSTAAIARQLQAPVILVVDAKSMGESVAAQVLGYKMYDPAVNIAGVIVNRLGSSSHADLAASAITKLGIPVLGCISRDEQMHLPERHLGLTPVTENQAEAIIETMGYNIARQVNIPEIIFIAKNAGRLENHPASNSYIPPKVKIGVAKDEVFSFYYPDSLEELSRQGAELVYFSPLHDRQMPEVDGLILGGGFPEMFLSELSNNHSMLTDIRLACQSGMPVYAECGGLMVLCDKIVDFDGKEYELTKIVPAVCTMQAKLETVGYVEVTAKQENILCCKGDKLRGHEFHFSRMHIESCEGEFPWAFEFKKMRTGKIYPGGFVHNNVLASYLHIHFAGNGQAAGRFVKQCSLFQARRNR